MIKQVIVLRTKYPDKDGNLVKPRTGKLISQICHASMAFVAKAINESSKNREHEFFDDVICVNGVILSRDSLDWLNEKFTKICLYVESEEELISIHQKAIKAGLTSHLIEDLGLTEFRRIPTKTCLAIGPDEASKIDEITGNLPLY